MGHDIDFEHVADFGFRGLHQGMARHNTGIINDNSNETMFFLQGNNENIQN